MACTVCRASLSAYFQEVAQDERTQCGSSSRKTTLVAVSITMVTSIGIMSTLTLSCIDCTVMRAD